MTRKQFERARQFYTSMERIGFDADEADRLRRIALTLHAWAERECNGEIERDGDDGNGKPYHSDAAWGGKHLAYPIPDRERGALKRLHAIMAHHPGVIYYHQGDPRGCALYLIDNRDGRTIPTEDPDAWIASNYNRGVAVCY